MLSKVEFTMLGCLDVIRAHKSQLNSRRRDNKSSCVTKLTNAHYKITHLYLPRKKEKGRSLKTSKWWHWHVNSEVPWIFFSFHVSIQFLKSLQLESDLVRLRGRKICWGNHSNVSLINQMREITLLITFSRINNSMTNFSQENVDEKVKAHTHKHIGWGKKVFRNFVT